MTYQKFKADVTEWLKEWDMYSESAVELLAMICAHESLGGKHRRQIGGGPALGVFQIEPLTHDSVWDNSDTIHKRAAKYGIKRDLSQLEHNDKYSVFVARHYLAMDRNPLPKNPQAMAEYCKSYWNRTGKATAEKYLADYKAWKVGAL